MSSSTPLSLVRSVLRRKRILAVVLGLLVLAGIVLLLLDYSQLRITHVATFPSRQGGIDAMCLTPDEKLLITGGESGSIHFLSTTTGNLEKQLPGHSARVTGLAITSDGASLLSTSTADYGKVWDLLLNRETRDLVTGDHDIGALELNRAETAIGL